MKSILIQSDNDQIIALIEDYARSLEAKIITEKELLSDSDTANEPEAIYADDEEMFKPMTIEEFNDRIDQSLKDIEEGRVISSEDLLEEVKTWG